LVELPTAKQPEVFLIISQFNPYAQQQRGENKTALQDAHIYVLESI